MGELVKPRRVLLSWSSGKDSAWTLHVLRGHADVEVVGLLTTFNEEADRVATHAVRRALVESQAAATGLPLWTVQLPSPCTNEVYEQRMAAAFTRPRAEGVSHVAFGDLFLEDIRAYRMAQLAAAGLEPLFPIWCGPEGTGALANAMLDGGLRAILACVDPRHVPPELAGREFDRRLLAELPASVDPCGERGEFHTFCYGGPMFRDDVRVDVGEVVLRDGFCFADLTPSSD